MEAAEVSQVKEFAREEKDKLEGELRAHQVRLETLASDNVVLTSKVATLEARAWAVEERLAQEEFTRDTYIREAVEEAVAKFKRSDKFTALLKSEHDVGYEVGYDVRVDEIFFNIWRKR